MTNRYYPYNYQPFVSRPAVPFNFVNPLPPGPTYVDFSWDYIPNDVPAAYFRIDVLVPLQNPYQENWYVIVPSNVRNYLLTGLLPSSVYDVYISSVSSDGIQSDYAYPIFVITRPAPNTLPYYPPYAYK